MAERSSLVRLLDEFELTLDWRGFELHPETPPGGIALSDVFGLARVASMREHMKRFAASFGITGMGSPARLPNTRRALAMAEYAREQGKLDALRDAAMRAHWEEGKNLERDEDLRAVARRAGLDEAAALAATTDPRYQARVDAIREEAEAQGVSGIPTFFFDGIRVVGCQPYEALADAARRAGARPRR